MNKRIASIFWSIFFFYYGVYLIQGDNIGLGIVNIIIHSGNILCNIWCIYTNRKTNKP